MRRFTLIVLCSVMLIGCSRHRGELAKAHPQPAPKPVPAKTEPDIKFGLTEPQRKQIYDQLSARKDIVLWMAAKKYPLPRLKDFLPEGNSGDKDKHSLPSSRYYVEKMAVEEKRTESYALLVAKHKKELATNHDLSIEQVNEIEREGMEKFWLFPPPPSSLPRDKYFKDLNKSGPVLVKQP